MNPNRTEGNWKQFAGDVKQRVGKMLDKQLDLWSGKRERAKQVTVEQPRQQPEPPK
jgi:uncharacterized protein YjbJ (UPF0337 family)